MNTLSRALWVSFLASTLCAPLSARADLKTFTLVQSQSSLFITGDVGGAGITPQGSGSLTTSYTGTIEVDLTDPVITFLGGSLIAGANSGTWQPGLGGVAGSAPANYGANVNGGLFTAVAAVRNSLFDVSSGGSTITAGAFPATDLTFFFAASSTTVIDYRYTVILSSPVGGSTPLTGTFPNANPNSATLIVQGAEYVLTIPVDISGVQPTTVGDINYRLRGKLVAKAPAPVTPVPLKITSFDLSGTAATMSIDTTPGQHFTILGTTNFSNWITNDAFTASVTNTTRNFSVPAPAARPWQYFHVRQD